MGISFNDDGDMIVSDWNGNIRVVDPVAGTLEQILVSGLSNNQWHQVAPDGSLIVDDLNNGKLLRYDISSGAF